jgi:hypothetical protein
MKRKVVGIGGIDAHAHKHNLLGFLEVEIFPYKVLFKSIRTHILTDDELKPGKNFAAAKKIIYKGLESGRCFFANDYHSESKGFRFFAQSGRKIYHMGDHIVNSDKAKLKVFLPAAKGEIKLIHNGIERDGVENNEAEFIVKEKGIYRIEVFLSGKAWIYTNHIRIG